MIRNAAEFTFSWSLRRQEMWNCCRRKYFLHCYAAAAGMTRIPAENCAGSMKCVRCSRSALICTA